MKIKIFFGAMIVSAVFFSCKKDEDEVEVEDDTSEVEISFDSLAINDTSLRLTTDNAKFVDLPIATAADDDGVSSLKMYFRQIQICESMEVSGSGYSNTKNCATIYENDADEYKGTAGPSAAERKTMLAASTGKFYDMLSAKDRAKLNKKVKVKAGKYNYGIIETHPWVKMKAKSGTLCTSATGAKEETATGGDGVKTYHTVVDSLTCTEPEEALVYITNANSNFKFLKTFEVKKGDKVTLDLAVDFNQAIRAIAGDQTYIGGNLRASDAENSFYVPMIKIGPAPRKTSETTKVETYTMGAATAKDQVRINVYYNSADKDKSVLAINGLVLGTATSEESKANKPVYSYKVTQNGDEVTLKSWDDSKLMTFTRGAAGTATVFCSGSGGLQALEECEAGETLSLVYPDPVISTL